MLSNRVIPVLLLENQGLVKTTKFKDSVYIGDPINAIKIFNDKEVDELVFLDIEASKNGREPDFNLISNFATECFMPLSYGGGIKTIEHIRRILKLGVEKVCINTRALDNPNFIKEAVKVFGSSTIIVSIDVKENLFGKYQIYNKNTKSKIDFLSFVKTIYDNGAGEIMINAVNRDGMMLGYDLKLAKSITSIVDIPVILCGGAGKLSDFKDAVEIGGASAVAAGSFFVFHGRHKAVLITYPERNILKEVIK